MAASRAMPAPLMPPPITRRSKVDAASCYGEGGTAAVRHGTLPNVRATSSSTARRLYHAAGSRHPRSFQTSAITGSADVGPVGPGDDGSSRREARAARSCAERGPGVSRPARAARRGRSRPRRHPRASVGPSTPSVPAGEEQPPTCPASTASGGGKLPDCDRPRPTRARRDDGRLAARDDAARAVRRSCSAAARDELGETIVWRSACRSRERTADETMSVPRPAPRDHAAPGASRCAATSSGRARARRAIRGFRRLGDLPAARRARGWRRTRSGQRVRPVPPRDGGERIRIGRRIADRRARPDTARSSPGTSETTMRRRPTGRRARSASRPPLDRRADASGPRSSRAMSMPLASSHARRALVGERQPGARAARQARRAAGQHHQHGRPRMTRERREQPARARRGFAGRESDGRRRATRDARRARRNPCGTITSPSTHVSPEHRLRRRR